MGCCASCALSSDCLVPPYECLCILRAWLQCFEQGQLGAKAVYRETQRKLPQWKLLGCKLKAVQNLSVSVSDMSECAAEAARGETAEQVVAEVDTERLD